MALLRFEQSSDLFLLDNLNFFLLAGYGADETTQSPWGSTTTIVLSSTGVSTVLLRGTEETRLSTIGTTQALFSISGG